MLAVEVAQLRRTYRRTRGFFGRSASFIEAVRGIDMQIRRGELFGLLGPNGAGKTTTIRMLTTLLLPSGGWAQVLGFDVVREPFAVRRRIGCVFGGERGLYDRLSALDNLRYFAELYGLPPHRSRERIRSVLELVGLLGWEHDRVEHYSRGMRQRLHLARGLLHEPEVVFLDEPTLAVDPAGAQEIRRVIRKLADDGRSVLLTTHYLVEADALCDRVAIMSAGRIVAEGTPQELKRLVRRGQVVEIEVYGMDPETPDRLRKLRGVESVTVEERDQLHLLRVQVDPEAADIATALVAQVRATRVGRFVNREPSLEDAYLELVARS